LDSHLQPGAAPALLIVDVAGDDPEAWSRFMLA